MKQIASFAAGEWLAPGPGAREIESALTGQTIALAGNADLPVQDMLDHARNLGGPALRAMGFHDRAKMLKALAQHLSAHKQQLYDVSFDTGATQGDHAYDIDGGIGTLFVYASKGRKELPDGDVYLDGGVEQFSRDGSFVGQHICTPLLGVAVHINAFNFPVWGMLEKLAPCFLAGVPAIVKPATATCYVTELAVRLMLDSGLLPPGALQLVTGGIGDMLDRLDAQDAVAFTGSADTALTLRSTPALLANAVRFTAEADSLNASILAPDAVPGTPEFDLFVKEVHREMTVKAGQKCTAIRRILAPDTLVDPLIDALKNRLSKTVVGDPRDAATRMGALVSRDQKADVLAKAALIGTQAERVFGDPEAFSVAGQDVQNGQFVPPLLYKTVNSDDCDHVHSTEAFGPVSTIIGYRDIDHAVDLANRGRGSLVLSMVTNDPATARNVTIKSAAWHGRIYINNRASMKESTGHGAPLPHMIHGGPGRAGGGEELGGIRGVMHYMQRTAVQGSPDIISAITNTYTPGMTTSDAPAHPFTRTFSELEIGETIHTKAREITLDDIEHFAHFTGDTFYAHMDAEAAKRNPFFPDRVAHGYLLLSFAAGLFVEPNEGPVLANTGLDNLRFMSPVVAGDRIAVQLTVKLKTRRTDTYGEVRWQVILTKQDNATVASYELLTMNAY